jgi:hypothetical protein
MLSKHTNRSMDSASEIFGTAVGVSALLFALRCQHRPIVSHCLIQRQVSYTIFLMHYELRSLAISTMSFNTVPLQPYY